MRKVVESLFQSSNQHMWLPCFLSKLPWAWHHRWKYASCNHMMLLSTFNISKSEIRTARRKPLILKMFDRPAKHKCLGHAWGMSRWSQRLDAKLARTHFLERSNSAVWITRYHSMWHVDKALNSADIQHMLRQHQGGAGAWTAMP